VAHLVEQAKEYQRQEESRLIVPGGAAPGEAASFSSDPDIPESKREAERMIERSLDKGKWRHPG